VEVHVGLLFQFIGDVALGVGGDVDSGRPGVVFGGDGVSESRLEVIVGPWKTGYVTEDGI
jgi:hypothetical protein